MNSKMSEKTTLTIVRSHFQYELTDSQLSPKLRDAQVENTGLGSLETSPRRLGVFVEKKAAKYVES